MKLEEELKQTKPFKSELQKLVLNISVTSSWLNSKFSGILKPFEITPHQYNVLRILKGKYPEGYCNHEITERMIDKSSNATRIVDKLVVKKFAVKVESKEDRRSVNIKITSKGIKLLEDIESNSIETNMKPAKFNEEKARLMNEWLDELRD